MSGDGLTLPATGGGISDETAAFAAELIDRSGKAPVIEAALARGTGGPARCRRARAHRAAVPGLDDRPLFLTEATRLLFQHMSPASRRLLGVPAPPPPSGPSWPPAAGSATASAHLLGMDPSALPKNRRLSQADLKARTRPMTHAQAEAARSRLRRSSMRCWRPASRL